MELLSLDELVERVVRTLYKNWYAAALENERDALDTARRDLAQALRQLPAGESPAGATEQGEDHLLAFLETLAGLPGARTVAADDLQRLPDLRAAVSQRRPPTASRRRGALVKLTDLSPARIDALVALLDAVEPAVHILSTMHYGESPPQRVGAPRGAAQSEDALVQTLRAVLEAMYAEWDALSPQTQDQVEAQLGHLQADLQRDTTQSDAGAAIDKTVVRQVLEELETLPEVVRVALPAFVAGKRDAPPTVYRAGGLDNRVPVGAPTADLITSLPTETAGGALEGMIGDDESTGQVATGSVPYGVDFGSPDTSTSVGDVGDNETPETVVEFQTDVHFPSEIGPGQEAPLIIQLQLHTDETSGSADTRLRFADPRRPEVVKVVLTAPAFQERTGYSTRLIEVYSSADSLPAVFLLQAGDKLGTATLTVDLYHRARMVGSFKYETAIMDDPARAAPRAQRISEVGGLEPLPVDPPPPADITLRVVKEQQDNTLLFTLQSDNPAIGYERRDVGAITLEREPRDLLADIFTQLDDLAGQVFDSDSAFEAAAQEEIESIGQYLFEELFPPKLQQAYWRLKALREAGKIRSLLIISDEPWIPWELIKPYRYDAESDTEEHDDFLAAAFRMSRWLAGPGLADRVNIQTVSTVMPELDLPYVQQEREFFDGLAQRGLRVNPPLRTRDEVLRATRTGRFQLLHLAAHGIFNPQRVDASPLILQNERELLPRELAGARVRGLRRERPIVFLNACDSGQLGFSLTGLGGWAERMVNDIRVSAFVGSLWEVDDELAAEFAQMFYNSLMDGQTLAEAFHAARQHIRNQQPGNPTWLAYTLYADPNGRAEWAFGEE